MLTADLDYDLPADRIATAPAEPRDAARLMVIHRESGRIEHRHVRDLAPPPEASLREGVGLREGDLLVFNQTRVLPAAFAGTRAATGGQVRGLYLHSDTASNNGTVWQVMLESRGTLREGETITLADDAALDLRERLGEGRWRAALRGAADTLDLLGRIGSTPLPPYIRNQRRARHEPEVGPADAQRYNTVFARDPGSVAAPTAALHFTEDLLNRLEAMGVARTMLTLHVGLGTFARVRSERLEDHAMHSEWVRIPRDTLDALQTARQRGGRVIPVGTTCVRALESLPKPMPLPTDEGNDRGFVMQTSLFIHPSDDEAERFRFRLTDALMTNFHLPRSTLLALVAALPGVGIERLKQWYSAAIHNDYRFYSYGDAMLIL
jgi:S-adenosylmethionine:tRNA ribosyltransferase-isomerase